MKYVYLDNAASTAPETARLQEHALLCRDYYANSESTHAAGRASKEFQDKCAEQLCRAVAGDEKKACVLWTNSGTESANAALALPPFRKSVIVTTKAEHPSILAAAERSGSEVRYAELTRDGGIDMDSLSTILDQSVKLLAVHHVQSETGRIQDIEEISKLLREKAPRAVFLVDTIQSLCKIPVPTGENGPGMMLLSGYKIGAPSAGAVIAAPGFADSFKKLRFEEHFVSRANPANSAILARQVHYLTIEREKIYQKASALSKMLRASLESLGKECILTIPEEKASPFIVHALFPGPEGAVLARMLSAKGVMVSAGSACSAESGGPSKALTAMGFKGKDAFSALRISLWKENTPADIEIFVNALKESLKDY